MSHLKGAVYDSPSSEFPALAVVFRAGGDVLVAKPVADRAEGEALLSGVMASVQAQIDAMFGSEND